MSLVIAASLPTSQTAGDPSSLDREGVGQGLRLSAYPYAGQDPSTLRDESDPSCSACGEIQRLGVNFRPIYHYQCLDSSSPSFSYRVLKATLSRPGHGPDQAFSSLASGSVDATAVATCPPTSKPPDERSHCLLARSHKTVAAEACVQEQLLFANLGDVVHPDRGGLIKLALDRLHEPCICIRLQQRHPCRNTAGHGKWFSTPVARRIDDDDDMPPRQVVERPTWRWTGEICFITCA